jgi:putative FmdB family regulatory protein
MPIFEYTCLECKREFEEIVFNSSTDVLCPDCKSSNVEKKMSIFGFKSGGTYIGSSSTKCSTCNSKSCDTC